MIETFEINYSDTLIKVEKLDLPGLAVFRVRFGPNSKAVTIARAINSEKKIFWTSIPEGNQLFAEEVGPLIDDYYKRKD